MSFFNLTKNNNQNNPDSLEEQFLQSIQELNCQSEREDLDNNHRYFFDFQGGHFIAIFYENFLGGEIIYPKFFTTSIDHVNTLRMIVNRGNAGNILFKFTYAIDEEDNDVNVSMSFLLTQFDKDLLQKLLQQCFVEQREFSNAFAHANDDATDAKSDDIESDTKNRLHERFLIKQQEFASQHPNLQFRPDAHHHLTVQDLMSRLTNAPECHFKCLEIVRDGQLEAFLEHDEIANFNLSSVLIADNEFITNGAVAILRYAPTPTDERQPLIATFTFQQGESDGSTLYFYIQITTDSSFYDNESVHQKMGTLYSRSILVAHDIADSKKKLQEFDYMWKDAQIKLRDKQQNELTEEQKLIVNISYQNISYNVYWGKRYYEQKRYTQALVMFEPVFRLLSKDFFNMNEEEKSAFFELCYLIGFCYCELKLFKQAYYYLDIIGKNGRIDFAMEYVNAMANTGDVRIFYNINSILDDINRNYNLNDEEEDIPTGVAQLISFLRRRNAFSLIEFNKLDEAEEEFKKLLEDPQSHDYAINELAYIKQLRKNSSNPGEKTDNDADNIADTNN